MMGGGGGGAGMYAQSVGAHFSRLLPADNVCDTQAPNAMPAVAPAYSSMPAAPVPVSSTTPAMA